MSEFGGEMAPATEAPEPVEAPSEPVDLGAEVDDSSFEEPGDAVVNGSPDSPEFDPTAPEFTEPTYPIPDDSSVAYGGTDLGATDDVSVDDATVSDLTAHDLGALALSDTVQAPSLSDVSDEQAAHDLGATAVGDVTAAPAEAGAQASGELPNDYGSPMLESDDEVFVLETSDQALPDLPTAGTAQDLSDQPLPELPPANDFGNPMLEPDDETLPDSSVEPLPDLAENNESELATEMTPEAASADSSFDLSGSDWESEYPGQGPDAAGTDNPMLEPDEESLSAQADQPLPELPEDYSSSGEPANDFGNPMLEPDEEALPESLPDLTASDEPDEFGPLPELDAAVDNSDGAGGDGKTDVGWEFLPDADKPFAQDVPEYPGEYVLDLHGSPDSVQVGADTSMDAAEFAETVKADTDWDGTTPIRLFSCSTGADQEGFAQQLSDELGVEVTAPTAPVWSVKDGEPVVTEADPDTGEPIDPPTGSWVSFKPSGK